MVKRKIQKQMTRRQNFANIVFQKTMLILSLLLWFKEIILVADTLNPKSVNKMKYAMNAWANIILPKFSDPKVLPKYGNSSSGII